MDASDLTEMADSLSMAFLLLLETLTPQERAVFLLREGFGYDYLEIAVVTGYTATACRQVYTRARRAIQEGKPRFGYPGRDGSGTISGV